MTVTTSMTRGVKGRTQPSASRVLSNYRLKPSAGGGLAADWRPRTPAAA